MTAKIVIGILIPFIGTSLGAAMVFFLLTLKKLYGFVKQHKLQLLMECLFITGLLAMWVGLKLMTS